MQTSWLRSACRRLAASAHKAPAGVLIRLHLPTAFIFLVEQSRIRTPARVRLRATIDQRRGCDKHAIRKAILNTYRKGVYRLLLLRPVIGSLGSKNHVILSPTREGLEYRGYFCACATFEPNRSSLSLLIAAYRCL